MKYEPNLKYVDLSARSKASKSWYRFRSVIPTSNYLGWKVHISLGLGQTPQAFDLIAPVIIKYSDFFKVWNIDKRGDIDGKQFTIYLMKDGDFVSLENLKTMLEEISALLQLNNIEPGAIPQADAKILDSQYLSLRNDMIGFGPFNCYIRAKDCGTNFNPGNYYNPYQVLIADKKFTLKEYISTPSIKKVDIKNFSLPFEFSKVLFGYLNSFVDMHRLLKEKINTTLDFHDKSYPVEYIKSCTILFSRLSEELDSEFIINNQFDINDVQLAFRYLSFVMFSMLTEERLHGIKLSAINPGVISSFTLEMIQVEEQLNRYNAMFLLKTIKKEPSDSTSFFTFFNLVGFNSLEKYEKSQRLDKFVEAINKKINIQQDILIQKWVTFLSSFSSAIEVEEEIISCSNSGR